MGLRSLEGLRAFCLELSSDQPSPGGGCASAAAGAISASLLVMACGITSRSKKHIQDKPRLDTLRADLTRLRDVLLSLAEFDANAYDGISAASRALRAQEDEHNRKALQDALRAGSEVPLRTATECSRLLGLSLEVAALQSKSASSDTFVAISLGAAAFRGAVENVEINLKDMTDVEFVRHARGEVAALKTKVDDFARKALDVLERRA